MKDPILFLDIDGVLNSEQWALQVGYGRPPRRASQIRTEWLRWEPGMVGELKRIILATQAKIVLSTSWRHYIHSYRHWPACFALYGFENAPILDSTPDLRPERHIDLSYAQSHRGAEVQRWRQTQGHLGPYVILDDGTDFYEHQPLLWCDPETGLTPAIADQAIEVLQGKAYQWDGYLNEAHRPRKAGCGGES